MGLRLFCLSHFCKAGRKSRIGGKFQTREFRQMDYGAFYKIKRLRNRQKELVKSFVLLSRTQLTNQSIWVWRSELSPEIPKLWYFFQYFLLHGSKQHEDINGAIGNAVYFLVMPYSSWQKGSVENGNKMVRRNIPKSCDVNKFSQAQINKYILKINKEPSRRCLGYKSTLQVIYIEKHYLKASVLIMTLIQVMLKKVKRNTIAYHR